MTTKKKVTAPATELGDETFLSAEELRTYMVEVEMASESKSGGASDRAEKARAEFIKALSIPVEITPEKISEVTNSVLFKLRQAAKRGATELLVMRFPNVLCVDRGRALNNGEKEWPDTLIGRPRQAYEFWRDHLQPAGYKLKAMIVEWPGGLPGDVGFFLDWKNNRR